eukprot:SAG31_NODE_38026_length_299_cov_1.245000_1_plen_70_part_10
MPELQQRARERRLTWEEYEKLLRMEQATAIAGGLLARPERRAACDPVIFREDVHGQRQVRRRRASDRNDE